MNQGHIEELANKLNTGRKYKLITSESKVFKGVKLYRIQALVDFRDVKAGSKGGWVESENNLSQSGSCWIYDQAKCFGEARIKNNATIADQAWVAGTSIVQDWAFVFNNARIMDGIVKDQALIYGKAEIRGGASKGIAGDYSRMNDKAHLYDAELKGTAWLSEEAWLSGGTVLVDKKLKGKEWMQGSYIGVRS